MESASGLVTPQLEKASQQWYGSQVVVLKLSGCRSSDTEAEMLSLAKDSWESISPSYLSHSKDFTRSSKSNWMTLCLWCLSQKSEYLICATNLLWRLETPGLPRLSAKSGDVMMPVPAGCAQWEAVWISHLFQDDFKKWSGSADMCVGICVSQ